MAGMQATSRTLPICAAASLVIACTPDFRLEGDADGDAEEELSADPDVEEADGPAPACAGLERLGPDILLADGAGSRVLPDVVWAGDAFVVAGLGANVDPEGDSIVLFRISASGTVSASDVRIAGRAGGVCSEPALAWSGSHVGLVWGATGGDGDESFAVRFARVEPDGDPLGDAITVRDGLFGSTDVDVAWTGGGWAATWKDYAFMLGEVYVSRIGPDGREEGEEMRVTASDPPSREPSLAWTGSEIALAWIDASSMFAPERVWFARLSDDGEVIDPPRSITMDSAGSDAPEIVWTGSGLAVAWVEALGGLESRVVITHLSPAGERRMPDVDVSGDGARVEWPAIAALDGSLAVAWEENVPGGSAIRVAVVREDDVIAAVDVTDGTSFAESPALAWSGSVLGIAWHDDGSGSQQIRFARFGCLP